jgi:hypothetical protein
VQFERGVLNRLFTFAAAASGLKRRIPRNAKSQGISINAMIVLSYFCRPAPPSLANHRRYANHHGYRHEWVDASAMPESLQSRSLYKYQVLLHALERAEPNEAVLLLSENAAIVQPVSLETLMAGRDWLLVRTETGMLPHVDVQVWRNTEAVRREVLDIWKKCLFGGEPFSAEAELLAAFDTHPWSERIGGAFPVVPAGFNLEPLWCAQPTFAISIPSNMSSTTGVHKIGGNPRFRDVLVDHINTRKAAGLPMLSFPEYAEEETDERSAYNPGQPIALMTLYSPDTGCFARIGERNIRRYCEQHGYTFYVHRDVPAEVGMKASGNWFKPWLLQGYMAKHEWVIWIDSDVLFADMDRKLEPLLEGRDVLLARDVGLGWDFNSGVMGFRRTAQNDAVLRELMADIISVVDKSYVYASMGDQHYFVQALKRHGLSTDEVLVNQILFNTYWEYRRPDSFIVHYSGMAWSARALVMAHDDALLPG